MSVYFFTGRPGNGKSLHMAEIIYNSILNGTNVISNIEIDEHVFDRVRHKEKLGKFIYVDNRYWLDNAYKGYAGTRTHYSYLDGLYNFALSYHKKDKKGKMKEGQTILVLDECQILFNARSWNKKDRMEWNKFFTMHRHYGYDCYLISQTDEAIDKQIRAVLQKKVEHRCINNFKWFGRLLGFLCGGKLFIAIESDYAIKGKEGRIRSYYFRGKKKFYDLYDSYAVMDGAEQPTRSEA